MKKNTFFITLLLTIAFQFHAPHLHAQAASQLPEQYKKLLPTGVTIPTVLPASIQDPLLLTGWVYLYNQTTSLDRWDGTATSGRALAEYIRQNQVVIEWDTHNECGGSSCTERPKGKNPIQKLFQKKGNPNPIWISTNYQDPANLNIAEVAGTLAHEAIHHMLPFGNVRDTVYEEYWAFRLSLQISRAGWLAWEGYDSLKAACLKNWIAENGLKHYQTFQLYPAIVEPTADLTTTTCPLVYQLPGETTGFPSGS